MNSTSRLLQDPEDVQSSWPALIVSSTCGYLFYLLVTVVMVKILHKAELPLAPSRAHSPVCIGSRLLSVTNVLNVLLFMLKY